MTMHRPLLGRWICEKTGLRDIERSELVFKSPTLLNYIIAGSPEQRFVFTYALIDGDLVIQGDADSAARHLPMRLLTDGVLQLVIEGKIYRYRRATLARYSALSWCQIGHWLRTVRMRSL